MACSGVQRNAIRRRLPKKVLESCCSTEACNSTFGLIKGEQLATALSIANARDPWRTQLKVIDPDDPPLIRLNDNQADEIEIKAQRLAIARAMGAIGLNEIALELTLPHDIDPESELLRPGEALRVRSPRSARQARASEQVRERRLTQFAAHSRRYEGREIDLPIPPSAALPFQSVLIRQGVAPELISVANALLEGRIEDHAKPFPSATRIVLESEGNRTALSYGDVMFSEMIWH